MGYELCYFSTCFDFKICLRARKVSGPFEKRATGLKTGVENDQPRPQGFSLKKWVGRPTHFLREKPWERGWKMIHFWSEIGSWFWELNSTPFTKISQEYLPPCGQDRKTSRNRFKMTHKHKIQHIYVRDGPLENLWGGGGRSTKKEFAQGKIKWKKFLHAK